MATKHPATRPANPRFSSGPCAKIPHFELEMLADAPLGRSHRAKVGKDKLKAAIEGTREVLGIPADYKIGIVPASDTGAVEMAMWSMLGARKATMVAWESFGSGWVTDVVKQLKIDAEVKTADYGEIVDLAGVDTKNNDVVFTWNGTASGVKLIVGGVAAGAVGLVAMPAISAREGAKTGGAKGAVKGFASGAVKGVVSAVVLPLAGGITGTAAVVQPPTLQRPPGRRMSHPGGPGPDPRRR